MFVIQHQPHRAGTDLRRELVACLLAHGSTFSRVGASGKPGAVHQGPKPHLREAGLPYQDRGLKVVPGDRILNQVLSQLKARLKAPLADKEWEKVAWLYDRI